MTSTPLPEQGGFNERLDGILKSIIESYAPFYKEQGLNIEYSVFQKHKAAIRTLVLDEIMVAAKPEKKSTKDYGSWEEGHRNVGWNNGIEQFEQNIRQAFSKEAL